LKGLEIAELYFLKTGVPMIAEKFPAYRDRIAAGLVGEGSECYGFDDELSRDHDWGPSFCLWLNSGDFEAIGRSLQREIDQLPQEFIGFKRLESLWGSGRTGVFEISQFYQKFIGLKHVPAGLSEWRYIPESSLAAATNGRVFTDVSGEFTAFRNGLRAFYPEDIRLKKMASRCMSMAQAGQYNYPRCIQRREYVAAHYALAQFIKDAISMVFLMNREYKPFYKWMHRSLKRLPILGESMYGLLGALVTAGEEDAYQKRVELIEKACQEIIQELRRQRLSDSGSDFLLVHGPAIQSLIQDSQIRSINVWIE